MLFKGIREAFKKEATFTDQNTLDKELIQNVRMLRMSKVNNLLDQGANINTRGEFARTPLHAALAKRSASIAFALMNRGADINAKDTTGDTPLHLASEGEDSSIVLALIANGADVNATNGYNQTPLHVAALSNCPSISAALVQNGADVTMKCQLGGITPVERAQKYGNADVDTEIKTALSLRHARLVKTRYLSRRKTGLA